MPSTHAAAIATLPRPQGSPRPSPLRDHRLRVAPVRSTEKSSAQPDQPIEVVFGAAGTSLRAPSGDLVVAAPSGTLRLRAETDIDCDAKGSTRIHALHGVAMGTAAGTQLVVRPTAVRLAARRIAAAIRTVRLRTAELRLHAGALALVSGRLSLQVASLERNCRREVVCASELSRRVTEDDSVAARWVRLFARGTSSVEARRVRLDTDESLEVQGRQIFVG